MHVRFLLVMERLTLSGILLHSIWFLSFLMCITKLKNLHPKFHLYFTDMRTFAGMHCILICFEVHVWMFRYLKLHFCMHIWCHSWTGQDFREFFLHLNLEMLKISDSSQRYFRVVCGFYLVTNYCTFILKYWKFINVINL